MIRSGTYDAVSREAAYTANKDIAEYRLIYREKHKLQEWIKAANDSRLKRLKSKEERPWQK